MMDGSALDSPPTNSARVSDLIPMLQSAQERLGYLPEETVREISQTLKIPESTIFGVASFYAQFRFVEPGQHTIKVCMGTACHVRGAPSILDEFKRWLKIEPDQTTEDKMFTLETVNCVGACALGPIATVDGHYHGQMRIKTVEELLQKCRAEQEVEGEDLQ